MIQRYEHSYDFYISFFRNDVTTTLGEKLDMVESPSIETQFFGVQVVNGERDELMDRILHDSQDFNETTCGIFHNVENIQLHDS